VIPVVGATKVEQMQDCVGGAVELDASHLERLDAVTQVELGYPHEFLQIKADTLGAPPPPALVQKDPL
jgi:hypothetical protein